MKALIKSTLAIFFIILLTMTCYSCARYIENRTFMVIAATVSGTIYFLSVTTGALFIYTIGYFRGVSAGKLLFASFFTPAFWIIKDRVDTSIAR